ncbi:hypothetical protein GUJ93_ZPchr0005g14526 [Zizania palustris]|uniref:VHS domain-containing protein n=1 Tax=Zizania palustris TaxID=103762 RepID=A0A8J5W0G8_ZIZPA|nr:hypothetical protein GUJ93_ZPchr0005g14526 [Zizania palustris]
MAAASAAVRVDKATSELLLGPDWTLNMDICDAVNSDHGQAKEVIKALKKRLQHKNSKVQFFALTLLETLMKNCGDYVHLQVVERDILQEMIKIVKKKTDMQLRDKILALLESWQEAFGGNGGKHPQYYWAYAEMKKSGLEFPRRSPDAAPIFTATRPASLESYRQPGYGMPVDSSFRLDEAMSSSGPSLSSSDLERMFSAVELLSEMLTAVNPHDREAVNDEIIMELVKQCRSDQKKIINLVTSLREEELLGQALDLNDRLQILLDKHDAIASGSPLPAGETYAANKAPSETSSTPVATVAPRAAVAASIVPTIVLDDEEDEDEDDEFSQLARRNSKFRCRNAESTSSGVGTSLSTTHDGITCSASSGTSTVSPPAQSNELSLPDPPAPVRTVEEQVMSDLLALTVISNPSPPHTPPTPQYALNQDGSPANDHSQPCYSNQGLAAAPYSSYVTPWAKPQSQTVLTQQQPPPQSQLPYISSPYPPPPWASEDSTEPNTSIAASSQNPATSRSAVNLPLNLKPLQQSHSFGVPLRNAGSQSPPINGSTKQPMPAGARRPSYVSSSKYFDDLFEKNADGSLMKVGGSIGGGAPSPYKA